VTSPAVATLLTTASSAITPVGASAPTLTDTAVLSGYFPTGTIVFTLTGPGAFSYTQTDTVSGNGSYTAGTTLATTVAGTYTWKAHYSGDTNNSAADDQAGFQEQIIVDPVSPTLTTTAKPTTVALGDTHPPLLTDSATLAGGANPTGIITFTLVHNNTIVNVEPVPVSGNGTYTTPVGFLLPTTGTATGTYLWEATYNGDNNNNPANDNGAPAEQVTVSAASPTITTTANPTTVHLGGRLQDSANLVGGYHPTGSITFKLYAPGVVPTVGSAAYTETVSGVNGNGAYSTSVGFVTSATGIWHWTATYNADPNNVSVSSGPLDEPVTVPQQADLSVIKTVNNASPVVGQVVTFTLTVHNLGPDAATNVALQDMLPGGLAFAGATASQGRYEPFSGQWTIGTLPAGATATLTIAVEVLTYSPQSNTAIVVPGGQFDPDLSNNSATAAVMPLRPPLPDIPSDIFGKVSLIGSNINNGLPNLAAMTSFVNGLYHDVLGRVADQPGLDGWVMALEGGASRAAVAAAFWNSLEHREIEVEQLYETLLYRPADPAGLAGWTSALMSGASEQDVEIGFLSSPEYAAKHPGNALFIESLYAIVLGRPASLAEVMGWEQAVQAGETPAVLARAFLTSMEGADREVNALYFQALGRAVDPSGLNAFAPLLEAGLPLEAVAVALYSSDEYYSLPH
jgi:uncharacterized repeat protein (TIGR01451 family)